MTHYQYKLGDSSLDCSSATSYSSAISVATPITDSLAALPDGDIEICVIGGIDSATFSDLSLASTSSWVKDRTGPSIASGFTLGSSFSSSSSTPTLTWSTDSSDSLSSVASYQVQIYNSSNDTVHKTWTTLVEGASLSLSGGDVLVNGSSYYFKVRAVDSLGNIGSTSLSSDVWSVVTAPTVVLTGAPSSYSSSTTLNVSISGTNVDEYAYKIGTSSLDCSQSSGYSALISSATNITDSIAGQPDGTIKICAIGKHTASGSVQAYASATSVTWSKDTTSPVGATSLTVGAEFASTAGTSSPTITWTNGTDSGSGVASHQVKVVDSNSNTDMSSYTSHTKGTAVTGLSLSAGKYKFKIKVTDNVGNYTESSSSDFVICPSNYVYVPALSPFTTAGFCSMKWEGKNSGGTALSQASGTPDEGVTRATAISRCQNNGSKYDLPTNSEWMSLARNIESVGSNWSGGSVKSGYISMGSYNSESGALCDGNYTYSGWSPSCSSSSGDFSYKRTQTLSNGEIIWDLGGNVHEWVLGSVTLPTVNTSGGEDNFYSNEPSSYNTAGWELSDGRTGSINSLFGPSSTGLSGCKGWGSWHCGMGAAGTNWVGDVIVRGGSVGSGGGGGIFSAMIYYFDPATEPLFGYRCVYHP